MIDDIEDGKINCVVTKDLSRLGRNYILTGQYTEIYFPSKGVRYYYSINEGAARRAKEMNSFSDYKPGSATAEYRHYVDKAFALAQEQKKRVDPMYHEKIDSLLDTYARKLAANMNHGYEIDARVPSILIAGGSNFPVRQKEKQNAARDSNMQEWQYIQGLLDKIRSTGMGGIRQDDPQAIPKLQKKLAGLEKAQETMKAVNAYYAPLLCPADGGQTAQRQGNRRQQEKADAVAGQVLGAYGEEIPRSGARRECQ